MAGTKLKPAPGGRVSAAAPVILVVEDDEINGEFISLILSAKGYTTLLARSAVEALRMCAEHSSPIHLLLTDVFLPDLNGFLLSGQVRAIHPETRVLYISGFEQEYLQSLLGSDAWIPLVEKPFVTEYLLQKVERTLR